MDILIYARQQNVLHLTFGRHTVRWHGNKYIKK